MRRFVPPPIDAFDPFSAVGDPNVYGPVRNAAYEAGFYAGSRAGRAAGLAEGEALSRVASTEEIDRLRVLLQEQTARNSVTDAITQLLAARDADRQLLEQHLRSAVSVAMATLFPSLMSMAIGYEIVALIDQALAARTPENITIRASAETIGAITARGLPQTGSSRVTLLPDANYSDAIDVAWTGGGMTFDPAALLHSVNETISPFFVRKDEGICQN